MMCLVVCKNGTWREMGKMRERKKTDRAARRLCCCSRLFSTAFVRCTTACAGGIVSPLCLSRWEMIVSRTDRRCRVFSLGNGQWVSSERRWYFCEWCRIISVKFRPTPCRQCSVTRWRQKETDNGTPDDEADRLYQGVLYFQMSYRFTVNALL